MHQKAIAGAMAKSCPSDLEFQESKGSSREQSKECGRSRKVPTNNKQSASMLDVASDHGLPGSLLPAGCNSICIVQTPTTLQKKHRPQSNNPPSLGLYGVELLNQHPGRSVRARQVLRAARKKHGAAHRGSHEAGHGWESSSFCVQKASKKATSCAPPSPLLQSNLR
jgi:hypothetical protein